MLARHSLVWLADAGWHAAFRDAPADARPAIAQWRVADRPAVVRRADVDAGADEVCAGIALPPDAHGCKKRIPLRIAATHVRRVAAPVRLEEAITALRRAWQPALTALAQQAGDEQISFRVYGSAALQSLTGLPYVTPASDIDLLWYPASRTELDAGVRLLAAHAAMLPLDGEIVFPGGTAVAWKEWKLACEAPSKPRVLVKDNRHVRLLRTDDLLRNLEGEPCAMH